MKEEKETGNQEIENIYYIANKINDDYKPNENETPREVWLSQYILKVLPTITQELDSLKQENKKLREVVNDYKTALVMSNSITDQCYNEIKILKATIKEAKSYIKGLKDGRFIFNNNAKGLLDILSKLE